MATVTPSGIVKTLEIGQFAANHLISAMIAEDAGPETRRKSLKQ